MSAGGPRSVRLCQQILGHGGEEEHVAGLVAREAAEVTERVNLQMPAELEARSVGRFSAKTSRISSIPEDVQPGNLPELAFVNRHQRQLMPKCTGRDPEVIGSDEHGCPFEIPEDHGIFPRCFPVRRQYLEPRHYCSQHRMCLVGKPSTELPQHRGGNLELNPGMTSQKAVCRPDASALSLPLPIDQEHVSKANAASMDPPVDRPPCWSASNPSSTSSLNVGSPRVASAKRTPSPSNRFPTPPA